MAHHHKSNRDVEGDPYSGHGRGLPRRPDQDELAERTAHERRVTGLRGGSRGAPGTRNRTPEDDGSRDGLQNG
ncbi:hypothetical protein JNUCC64_07445 [Streptomyces sp. JNUCC 64]